MKQMTGESRLRLARMAAESMLREVMLPEDKRYSAPTGTIARRIKEVLEEIDAEWEVEPTSREIKEGLRVVTEYFEYLANKR